MRKKSSQIALGGLFSALCLVLLFLTGLFPFATFALPALAGAMLIAVVVEMGCRVALTVYGSIALLSLLIVADKEAVLMFVFFFGYYPVLKEKLERLPSRLVEYLLKFAIFNAMMVTAYTLIIYVFGFAEILEEFGEMGQYGALILLAMGNVVFLLYDTALTRYITFYIYHFRRRFLRK